MGCGLTKAIPSMGVVEPVKRRDTAPLSVDDLKHRLLDDYKHVVKRFGHPQYYKNNGYTLGVRVDGVGRYQTFYVGHCRFSSGKVTVKEHHMATNVEEDIIRETLILAKLSHPNLPQLREIFITDWSLYVVMSKIETVRLSTLYDFRPNSVNPLSLGEARCIIGQVTEAVRYCHSLKIVVRNLSPKNIAVTKTDSGVWQVTICDFSMAVNEGCHDYVCESLFFHWGQVPFMAPEALLGNEFSYPMDMWAIGVLTFLLTAYALPFDHPDDVLLVNLITHAVYHFPSGGCRVPPAVRAFINQCLEVDAVRRLTDSAALENEWLSGASELAEGEEQEEHEGHREESDDGQSVDIQLSDQP